MSNNNLNHCLTMTYIDREVTVEYALWNTTDNAYTRVKSKVVYQTNGEQVNYQNYNWNEKENSWNLAVRCSSNSNGRKLLAERK